jgi:hypothetical protein
MWPQIENIYFLERIGASLRWATAGITEAELPETIHHPLRRLDFVERTSARRYLNSTGRRE